MTEIIQYAVFGIGFGAIYCLIVQGMITIYAGSGVLNLAQAAQAMLAAYLYRQFHHLSEPGLSVLPAAAIAIGISALVGALVYILVMRQLRNSSALAKVAATLGVLLTIQGACAIIWGPNTYFVPTDLPNQVHRWGGVVVPEERIWLVVIAFLLTLGLWSISRFTRVGMAIRAGAHSPRSLASLGWSADAMATASWALGSAIAGLAGVLLAPVTTLDVTSLPLLVIWALAAALLAGMTNYWICFGSALAIGLVQSVLTGKLHVQGIDWSLPFAAIVLVLLVRGKGIPVRGELSVRLPKVGDGFIRWRWVIPIVLVFGYFMTTFQLRLLGALIGTFSWAIIMLSVVVLLGYTNQLSFEQMAMAGLATLIGAQLIYQWDIPFVLAVILAILCAVPIGAAFALPALRTRGVNLAVVTLGLGAVVQDMILTREDLVGYNGVEVTPPSLFGFSLDPVFHTTRYAIMVMVMFAICAILVANIRRGKAGSALIAIRTNERAAAALGIDVLRTKLFAFIIGASLASLGGILLAFQSEFVAVQYEFTPFNSMLAVAYTVFGGIGFVLGPLVGGTLAPAAFGGWLIEQFWDNAATGSYWLTIIGGVSLMGLLVLHPDGAVEVQGHLVNKIGGKLRRLFGIKEKVKAIDPLPEVQRERVPAKTLEVRDLTVRFGGVVALESLSMSIGPGEVVGLIGPNGAGKTTAIDAITGFVRPAAGELLLDGVPIGSWPVHKRVWGGIARSFQSLELFEESTLAENLRVASDPRNISGYFVDIVHPTHRPLSSAAVTAVKELELAEEMGTTVSDLPYGHRRLAAIARTAALSPSLLLLDEPAAGLSGNETTELVAAVRRLASEWGIGILVIEHDMNFVMGVCDRIVVLDFGKQIASGTPEEIRNNPHVIAAYLGEPDSDTETDATPVPV